jgi:predicted RNA-binding Zn ribbon-like protein
MEQPVEVDKFDLEVGVLCLDFANTVDWHASEDPQDRLDGYDDLILWGEAAEILSKEQADHLRQLAAEQPASASIAFSEAVRLREGIYRIFVDLSEQKNVNGDDLAILNSVLSRAMAHLKISAVDDAFDWAWVEGGDALDQVLWPVARSAGELLTSDELDRVRQCADDRGCGYLFIDTSRNRSRRWCSMETCGNRAKARRFYERQQEDE